MIWSRPDADSESALSKPVGRLIALGEAYPELGRGPVSLEDCVSEEFYEKERSGFSISPPDAHGLRPNRDALAWHFEERFRAA